MDGMIKELDYILDFELPDTWEISKFKNVCNIARGGSPRPIKDFITYDNQGINWIKIGDAEKGGKYIYKTKEKIKPEGVNKSRFVENGDFLLTNSMSYGRPYILKTSGCIHDGWLVIGNIDKCFNQDYLYYLLSSNTIYSIFKNKASGSTVENLNSDLVKESIVIIPPKNEQNRISKKTDDILKKLEDI